MLNDFWTVLFVGGMFVLIIIEILQISNKFGDIWINMFQVLVYLMITVVYWINVDQPSFSLGTFLRITTLLFIVLFFLDVVSYPKEGKAKKWLIMLSFIKLFPLVGIIFKLTAHLM